MTGIILILPILPGKVEAWRRFCQEISGSRRSLYEDSRLHQRVTHERLSLVETLYSAAAITTLEAEDLAFALREMLTSDRLFDRWYRDQIHVLHGVILMKYDDFTPPTPELEDQETLFEWTLFHNSNGSDGAPSQE